MRPRLLLAMLLVLPVSAPAAELSGRDVMIRMFMARAQGADDAATVFRLDLVSRDGSAVTRTVATYRLLEADYRTGLDCERFSARFLPRGP